MNIREDVKYSMELIKEAWLTASDTFPDYLTEISFGQKQQNELYLQEVSEEFHRLTKRLPRLPFGRGRWKKKMLKLIFGVLYEENVIGFHHSLQREEIDAFYQELSDFLRKLRQFCPELRFEEIGQGIRNYIVYAMFKVVHQINSGFSQAGFGYSMLYPFTDNYIDSNQRTPEEKLEYNQLIRNKILGNPTSPRNLHHRKTCDLLQAIASEYPRDKDDRIYTLLLMMLEAQEASLHQQNRTTPLDMEQRLDISLLKGGVSVLIDRFLVNKELTQADLVFYLGFGFFLQLADDLQDIEEDSSKGHQTLFTLDTSPEQEEKLVNKLLNFLHRIMEDYCAENDIFKDFISDSSRQLILSSLIGSKEFFTAKYRADTERYLPVSASFLEAAKANDPERQDQFLQDNYIRILDLLIS